MVHVGKYTIHGWYGIGKKWEAFSVIVIFSGSILVFRGRYLLTRPFRGTSEPGGSCARPTSLRIAAHQSAGGWEMSEVGHLIINGSLYVVLCHVFFCRGVIRLPNFCWRGIKLDATFWRFFEKSEKFHAVFWLLTNIMTPCFSLLLRPVSWWWILCGHEHLCIPTSEVTSRMKREPARQAYHSRSRRIFFPHFFVAIAKVWFSNVCELTPFPASRRHLMKDMQLWSSFHKFPSDFWETTVPRLLRVTTLQKKQKHWFFTQEPVPIIYSIHFFVCLWGSYGQK